MKLSKRLTSLALLVDKDDNVADVGCDHAYLSIHLAENNLCNSIVATEIAEGPYNVALKNIKSNDLREKIKLYLTDGLKNVEENIDTIIISGMGATTIIKILNEYKNLSKIKKLIIQSNNDWEILRRYLNNKGFYIEKEIYTAENEKDYITILATKKDKTNKEQELIMGVYSSLNKDLYINQKEKLESLLKKIADKNNENYKKYQSQIDILNEYLN